MSQPGIDKTLADKIIRGLPPLIVIFSVSATFWWSQQDQPPAIMGPPKQFTPGPKLALMTGVNPTLGAVEATKGYSHGYKSG